MIWTLSLVGAGLWVTIVPQSLTMVRMDNVVLREIAVPRSGYTDLNLVALKRADEATITAFRKIVANLLRNSP